jgi:long-chain acyl-CoA synthetase
MAGRETIARLPFFSGEEYPERPAQRFKRDGVWQDLHYGELRDAVREIALGLIALDVRPGDRVCVLSDTRPEWAQVEFAIAAVGGVIVPVYPSSSPDECAWVIGDSGAVAVVAENDLQLAKIASVRDRLPALRAIIVIDPAGSATARLDQVRAEGRVGDGAELDRRVAGVRPDDPALIVYTSGATGRAKGCVLRHRNVIACGQVTEELAMLGADDVAYLFLPLAHMFAQAVQLSAAAVGAVVAYCSDGPAAIMSDCTEVRPTFLPSVPRVFEKVHAEFARRVPAETIAAAVAADQAITLALNAGTTVLPELEDVHDEFDARLFARVRAAFGGRVRTAICGAAPVAPQVLEFFHASGVPVFEGYGLSEAGGVATLNTPTASQVGSVGRAVPGCEIRIAEDGEVLIRGAYVFAGYWNDAEATAEALVDGWLRTGDLGAVDEDGYLSINGRKKDINTTAGSASVFAADLLGWGSTPQRLAWWLRCGNRAVEWKVADVCWLSRDISQPRPVCWPVFPQPRDLLPGWIETRRAALQDQGSRASRADAARGRRARWRDLNRQRERT